MAPSATMIMFNLEPLDRVWGSEHICFTKKTSMLQTEEYVPIEMTYWDL